MTPTDTIDTDAPTRPRFTGLRGADETTLLPSDVGEAVPKAVQAANVSPSPRTANAAGRAPKPGRRAAIPQAAAADRAADAAAHAAGQPIPEQRAEAAAREAFVLADRRPDRGAQRFEARVRVFLTSVLDHRPTWRPAQQRAVSTATDEIRGLIDQLSVAFHRLAVERRLLAGLDSVPSNGPVSMIRFSDIDVQDAAREDAAGDVARAAQLGSAHGGALVGSARRPSVDRLLALLARAVREAG